MNVFDWLPDLGESPLDTEPIPMNETNEGFTVTLRVKDADGMEVDWSFDTWGGPEATAGEAIDTALQYCDHEVVGFVGVEVNAEREEVGDETN